MSTLNNIKKIRKLYPNDQEFGAAVAKYIEANKTCCDYPENIIEFKQENFGPYGHYVEGTKCLKCGSVIDLKVE